MSRERLGIFGGTFDPIHLGHLDLARACRDAAGLDLVLFLANRLPPHKTQAHASGHHRHAMVALATLGEPSFVADPRELRRDGPSYTIDTLTELGAERPEAELFFLTGSDSLRDLTAWRRWRDLLERATFVVVGRAGLSAAEALAAHPAGFPRERIVVVDHEPPALSSTALRGRLRAGEMPAGEIPEAVLDYIRKNRLYAAAAPGPGRTE